MAEPDAVAAKICMDLHFCLTLSCETLVLKSRLRAYESCGCLWLCLTLCYQPGCLWPAGFWWQVKLWLHAKRCQCLAAFHSRPYISRLRIPQHAWQYLGCNGLNGRFFAFTRLALKTQQFNTRAKTMANFVKPERACTSFSVKRHAAGSPASFSKSAQLKNIGSQCLGLPNFARHHGVNLPNWKWIKGTLNARDFNWYTSLSAWLSSHPNWPTHLSRCVQLLRHVMPPGGNLPGPQIRPPTNLESWWIKIVGWIHGPEGQL